MNVNITSLANVLKNKRLKRYFIMAVTIVIIELATFQVLYVILQDYILATFLSFTLAVILNWIAGRMFVFGISSHHPAREFLMVLVASIIGVMIQIGVVYVAVSVLYLYPLIGKGLSIIFSFFWNYLFRSRIVYKDKS